MDITNSDEEFEKFLTVYLMEETSHYNEYSINSLNNRIYKLHTTINMNQLLKILNLNSFYKYKENSIIKECSICYENISTSESVKLKCNHIFHKECMEQWVKKSGTCPLCRYNIFLCDKCSGGGIVYYQYTGIVIPLEERGSIMNRNQSNGIFGIHSYDFEDLVLNSMYYDNKHKKLFIDISG